MNTRLMGTKSTQSTTPSPLLPNHKARQNQCIQYKHKYHTVIQDREYKREFITSKYNTVPYHYTQFNISRSASI